jgi:PAS domain S-box-containing protein
MRGASRINRPVSFFAVALVGWWLLLLSGCLHELFSASATPRRYLYQSQPGLLWTNVVMSGVTAVAYVAILGCLLWLAKRLRKYAALASYRLVFTCFTIFIGMCALTQLMGIITLWLALYSLATLLKVVSAAATVATAVFFLQVTPRLRAKITTSLELLAAERQQKDAAQAMLQESQERLGFALGASKGIGTWQWDIPSGLVRSDATVARIFGADVERAAAGVPVAEYMQWIEQEDVHRVNESLAASLARHTPFVEEYRITQPGFPVVWVSARGQCGLDADGTLLQVSGVVVDITERKWSEQVLLETAKAQEGAREAEKLVRMTEESLSLAFVGTWDWDLRTGLITSNAMFASFYGIPAEQALAGAPFEEFAKNVPEQDLAVMGRLVETAIATGEDYTMEHRVKQADGSTRWVAVRARCKYAEDGTALRFPGVSIDITDRKQSEDALVQTERQKKEAVEALSIVEKLAGEERIAAALALAETNGRFRLLVEGVSDHALFTIDACGEVTSWNRGAERLLGHREEAIVGRNFACLFSAEDIANGVPEKQIEKAREMGRAEHDGWHVRANGDRFWANVSKTAFLEESGAISGFAVIIQDTTERKKVASNLEEARLERTRLQEKFLSHVSHELRTPLTAIYFFISNVADGVFGELLPEQREHLGFALENVTQLKEMVSDLLDITRVDSNKLAVEPQHASAARLMAEVRSTCLRDAQEKEIQLIVDDGEDLPAIWADPARVRQILTNLIENGIKFTPARGTIRVHAEPVLDEPGFLRFSVSDTGCGIAPSHLQVVFNRLAQVSENPDMSRSGLGLGLFIASELVVQHGGRIWVESELGKGSTFFFTLPVFSLARLCTHVLTPRNLALGCATLIAVDLVMSEGSRRSELMPEVHKVLSRCVHPGQDVLLPWMGDTAPMMTFFIVACTDNRGFSVIASRIGMELKGFGEVTQLRPQISSTTVLISPGLSGDKQVEEVTTRFEHLIEAHLQGQEKFQ